MNPSLHSEITRRLDRDFEFKRHGKWLQQGICPACGKKELHASEEAPWVLRCGRLNKCGAEYHVKELYPEIFESWSDRHPVTPKDPNAAADAYLRDARGFDLNRIKGWYTQENYWDGKQGSATVRFSLPGVGYWERIIDRPERFGNRKANFRGDYGGTWWQAPDANFASHDITQLWLVEGIFDAIALQHNSIAAVSALTCNNYPEKSLKALAQACDAADIKRPELVWALDGDSAGQRYTKQWVEKSRTDGWVARAAQIPQNRKAKLDWNDLHQRERLTPKNIEDYLYHGALLIAGSAHDKALLMYNRNGYNTFHFGFKNRLYWFEVDLARFGKAKEELHKAYPDLSDIELRNQAMTEAHTLTEIANCYPTALYFQANALTDESWYYLRVDFPHDGPSIKNTFTGSQLSSAGDFKKRMLGMAPGAVFTGNSGHLDRIMKDQLFNIKTVQTIDFIGYSKEHGAYVFGDIAVKDGRIVKLNDEDFFDIGKLSIKSLNQSIALSINYESKELKTEWLEHLWKAYGAKGIIALAFWLGSLFAEQIRAQHKTFPFLEIVGDPGAGKTTLIEFLWRILGRSDWEGVDPSKSTLAARSRYFSQVSNLPVVLIEAERGGEDKAHAKGFDWDELKTAYNGRSVRSRGVKNSGNETYDPPFRGAIVISQNADVSASPAMLERIVYMHFDLKNHTSSTRESAQKLERYDIDDVSAFILHAVVAEKKILDTVFTKTEEHQSILAKFPEIKTFRIIKNHAQIMGLIEALRHVVPLTDEQFDQAWYELTEMAKARQQAINMDHPMVQEFWEAFDYLNGEDDDPRLNHSRDKDLIAVNLNHFMQYAQEKKQQVPVLSDLKRLLKTSRARKFVESNKPINSFIRAKQNEDASPMSQKSTSLRCWIFKRSQS